MKEVVRAFQFEVDEKRKVLFYIAGDFLPILESIMGKTLNDQSGSDLQLKIMIVISKIFFMMNYLKVVPFLIEEDKIQSWIQCFVMILESQQAEGSFLIQQTDDQDQIEQLDNHDWWKLKAICCKISLKLFTK